MINRVKQHYDVAVVGGGAAGMMAAIQAARQGCNVVIVEYNDRLGRKLLATGNGRCNFSNLTPELSNYRGAAPDFVQTVYRQFDVDATMAFFRELGIEPINKDGLLYPRSQQASAVVEVLQMELRLLQIAVIYSAPVKKVERLASCFSVVMTDKSMLTAQNVILATGGQASAIRGSSGDGYYLARLLGHSIVTPMPALVQLHSNLSYLSTLTGVRTNACVTITVDDAVVGSECGELQWTEYGISGIVVFQLSRFASYALEAKQQVNCQIDFLPDITPQASLEDLKIRFWSHGYGKTTSEALIGLLHDKVIAVLLDSCEIAADMPADSCSMEQLLQLHQKIHSFVVPINGTHGMKHAQVTAGGVDAAELNADTMESRIVPGLFFAGELVDVDGICGGYNLQWAWSSGAVAGMHVKRTKYDSNQTT